MTDAEGGADRLGAFDTDTAALTRRIQAHARFGSHDLNPWVLEQLDLADGQRVLELGCGTGKQTVPVAEAVGPTGSVLAIDASTDALQELGRNAAARGVDQRIEAARAEFDEREWSWADEFDRAFSCYALYYAREPRPLMEAIARGLREDGLFFFCGPAARNNAELKEFCASLRGESYVEGDDPVYTFMERTGAEAARSIFGRVELLDFENPLRFDSAEALCEYWTSYNLFDPDIEDEFRAAAHRHFEAHPIFETVKRVRGVRALKEAARG